MTIIADTGAIYALYDADDSHHAAIAASIEHEISPIVLPMAVVGELDYLLLEFLGVDAEIDFLDSIVDGAFVLEPMTDADARRCREIVLQYRDLGLGLVDAAVLATAERLRTHRILTVDMRDFRAVTDKDGKPFVLLPADS